MKLPLEYPSGGASPPRFRSVAKSLPLIAAALMLTGGNSRAVLPDVLFSAESQDITTGPLVWPTDTPGTALVTMATPSTTTINGEQWARNFRASGTGFRLPGPDANESFKTPIAVDGASIVVAVRPIRNSIADGWNSVVDIFYNRLMIGVHNESGRVQVWRNGSLFDSGGTTIPNGQITILSLVVQPTGEFKVFANGDQIMDVTATSPMTSLDPTWNGPDGFWQYINIGRNNPDTWPTFNGNIGDVTVFKGALDDADRETLEASLMTKFGTSTDYNVTASANTGGSITPSGAVSVPQNTSIDFTIAADSGFEISNVLVDGASQGAITFYSFPDVMANHTIEAVFTELPKQLVSGKVTDGTDGIENATVSFNTGPDASVDPTFTTNTTDSEGNFSIELPVGEWYYTAGETQYFTAADATVTVVDEPITLPDIQLTFNPDWELLFSLNTDDFSGLADGERILTWEGYSTYQTYNNEAPLLGPTVEVIDGVKWEKNVRAPYDDSTPPTIHDRGDGVDIGIHPSGIPTDGVTIVAVVRPEYKVLGGEPRGEIVDIFYGELFLATNRNTGEVIVCTRGYNQQNTGYFIPDGQKTILSLVVQPTGEVTLYANGVKKWTYESGADYTSLQWHASFSKIAVGRNGYDGWSAFNGNIGDVMVYKVALEEARRETLQEDLAAKFGIILPNAFTITASTGSDGFIDPSGEVEVEEFLDQTFTISPAFGFQVDDVLVDGVSVGATTSYTFTNVTEPHTISATFKEADLYTQWIGFFFDPEDPDAARGMDPDNDSMTNLEEFAFDQDPTTGAASGKMRSRIEEDGGESALMITLPVLDGAVFEGSPSLTATVGGVVYTIEGSNNLNNFDQEITEVTPARSEGMVEPFFGWTYRTFRLSGSVGGEASRGSKGFLKVSADAVPEAP